MIVRTARGMQRHQAPEPARPTSHYYSTLIAQHNELTHPTMMMTPLQTQSICLFPAVVLLCPGPKLLLLLPAARLTCSSFISSAYSYGSVTHRNHTTGLHLIFVLLRPNSGNSQSLLARAYRRRGSLSLAALKPQATSLLAVTAFFGFGSALFLPCFLRVLVNTIRTTSSTCIALHKHSKPYICLM